MADTKALDAVEKIKNALITQKRLAKLAKVNEIRLSRCLNRELEFTPKELESIGRVLHLKF